MGEIMPENNSYSETKPPRVNVLGMGVSAVNMSQVLDIIDGWIERGEQNYICVSTVHSAMECYRSEEIRLAHNSSGLTLPDGMPLVWLCKLAGFKHTRRVCGPDLLPLLCKHSVAKGYRHFFYGGAEGVPDMLAERLSQMFPGLKVAGTFSPPFRPLTPEEDEAVVKLINSSGADVVWVGLGCPKQELWMAEDVGRIKIPVMIGVGAAFDFHAGIVDRAPIQMQRLGLEWLYRLFQEPRRLWRRYVLTNPLFLMAVLLQLIGLKRYSKT